MLVPAGDEIVGGADGDDVFDACLTNSASTVHARRMSNKQSTAVKKASQRAPRGDGVEFGVAEPEVFLRTRRGPLVFVGAASARRSVVAERADFVRPAQNDRANFRARVFAES